MDALPLFIYINARQPFDALNQQAWGVGAAPAVIVLTINVAVRSRSLDSQCSLRGLPRWPSASTDADRDGGRRGGSPHRRPIRGRHRRRPPRPTPADPSVGRRRPRAGAAEAAGPSRSRTSTSTTARSGRSTTSRSPSSRTPVTAIIGPSGCGKSTFLRTPQPDARADAGRRASRARCRSTAIDIYGARGRPGRSSGASSGWSSSGPNPFPTMSIYDNVVAGLRLTGRRSRGRARRGRRALPPPGRAVGRGQGQAQGERARRSRAGSSSGCASPGRSRSTRR